jgi:cytochrome c oxidase cbb3-type subunit III
MRFAVLLAAIAVLGLAGPSFAQEAEIRNPHTTPADVAAGAKIFRSHCAECHGPRAEGGRGPSLTTGVFFHGNTDADLYSNISNGITSTAMPSLFFPPDGVWQVVAYVRSLSQGQKSERPSGDAAHGAALFREKGCNNCHLVRGEGGVKGPDLSVIGSQRSAEHLRQALLEPNAEVPREYWVAKITLDNGASYSGFVMNEDTHSVQLLDFNQGLRSLSKQNVRKFDIDKSSVMPSYRGQLSGSQVNDLVAYLWSLQRGAAH